MEFCGYINIYKTVYYRSCSLNKHRMLCYLSLRFCFRIIWKRIMSLSYFVRFIYLKLEKFITRTVLFVLSGHLAFDIRDGHIHMYIEQENVKICDLLHMFKTF